MQPVVGYPERKIEVYQIDFHRVYFQHSVQHLDFWVRDKLLGG